MPISPESRRRYPKDWPEISARIKARAGGRCECLVAGERCAALDGAPHPVTGSKVVLTVMHLDHQPENCADENLRAGCQRCHNAYDAPHRRANAARTRARRKAAGDLFEGLYAVPLACAAARRGPHEIGLRERRSRGARVMARR